MYIKENRKLKCQFILGDAKIRLGSSVLYHQAEKQRFWADLKAWDQAPKASPSPNLVFLAKLDVFLIKIAKFLNVSII